ncbi:MAG TPA: hypothetical protein VKX46_20380 [Ktedonobacteraceae bacterium]|nr:hypothetical protein [Ktedonobacteraceae bacterium]
MPDDTRQAMDIKIGSKGLSSHLQEGEQPLLAEPGIWNGGENQRNETCDVVVTNKRLLGYYYRSFPREKTFLDALDLKAITAVSWIQENYSPIFRELLVKTPTRQVSIRTPHKKSEALYVAIRAATDSNTSQAEPTSEHAESPTTGTAGPTPTYERRQIRTPFDNSPLAITILFIGGLILEIGGIILWATTNSSATGLPLFAAGLVAVVIATLVRRQRR